MNGPPCAPCLCWRASEDPCGHGEAVVQETQGPSPVPCWDLTPSSMPPVQAFTTWHVDTCPSLLETQDRTPGSFPTCFPGEA